MKRIFQIIGLLIMQYGFCNEPNKELVTQYLKAFENNESLQLNAYLAQNVEVILMNELRQAPFTRYSEMSRNLSVRCLCLHRAIEGFKIEIDTILSEGNVVFVNYTISGIQKGPFLGIDSTNKPIFIRMMTIFSIENGKICKLTEMWNEYSVMKQIGYLAL